MIESVRGRMRGLQKSTKKRILRGTMMLLLSLAVLFLFISTQITENANHAQKEYLEYLARYSKQYSEEQKRYRNFVFYETRDEIVFNKKEYDQSYTEGLNQFSDLTEAEFQELYLIVTSIAKAKGYQEIAQFQNDFFYDWQAFLPPLKNMRDFDASHIFAAVASAEFELNKNQVLQYRALNQTLELNSNWITLSEQEVIDCCSNCLEKKLPSRVYAHLIEVGANLEASYPYVSSIFNSRPGPCRTEAARREFRIKAWHEISGCAKLSEQLMLGPVVVSVDARNWRTYEGGILTSCGNLRNHYALLVGRGIGFWKLRNSWGRLWGEHGHIRIKSGNTCALCTKGSYAELQD